MMILKFSKEKIPVTISSVISMRYRNLYQIRPPIRFLPSSFSSSSYIGTSRYISNPLTSSTSRGTKPLFTCRNFCSSSSSSSSSEDINDDDRMEYDILIVGAGPAGLSAAIRAKQIDPNISVCVLEKGSYVGAHIISGNVFEPNALDELLPKWREEVYGSTLEGTHIIDSKEANNVPNDFFTVTPVKEDNFYYLSENSYVRLPTIFLPTALKNGGNFIISLGDMCGYLSQKAEILGVDIYTSTSVKEPIFDKTRSTVIGMRTMDQGVKKDGQKKQNCEPGIDIFGQRVIIAEGARGSITLSLIKHFHLDRDSCPQRYSLGVKEVWDVKEEYHIPGLVQHFLGFPNPSGVNGGSFEYHFHARGGQRLVHLGYVISLDYADSFIDPHYQLQRLKTHPFFKKRLEGGTNVSYGARVISTGGYQSLPRLSFPGGLLVGCSAGLLNMAKIKGTHTAIKSGMLAAESIISDIKQLKTISISHREKFDNNTTNPTFSYTKSSSLYNTYEDSIKKSWIHSELYSVRNIKPSFSYGHIMGLVAAFICGITKGREPFTLRWKTHDWEATSAEMYQRKYTEGNKLMLHKPDDNLTFDILTSLSRTGVYHEEDQPSHLIVKTSEEEVRKLYKEYGGPESRFCPARVYEYEGDTLRINAQNCIHCKCCSIKTPNTFIEWTVPEGGGGPNYKGM